ncbi:hypothetical protein K461DRAFT_274707 [Myriangium duriaei CBS 260.36]|uniref:Uncharacterized protein n=1 Tax=Myriangium duriaei CBS 260.36 TaxID=1168546 RepID=A0A9P4J5A9_9PEZI|nr:hypothetical protein K461DRAFT_274707 [Myriangium duriaei CBS 260.36]
MRADLSCAIATATNVTTSLVYNEEHGIVVNMQSNMSHAPSCPTQTTSGIDHITFTITTSDKPGIPSRSGWHAMVVEQAHKHNASECPSLIFSIGNYSIVDYEDFLTDPRSKYNQSQVVNNITVLQCFQLMTQVQANVTLDTSSWIVRSAVADESTVTYFNSDNSAPGTDIEIAKGKSFPYHTGPGLYYIESWETLNDSNGRSLGWRSTPNEYGTPFDAQFNPFFRTMFQPMPGRANTSQLTDVVGTSPDRQQRLVREITKLYRQYMAQVLNAKLRTPRSSGENKEPFQGTLDNHQQTVVRQDRTSKIILQSLIATILVCSVTAYILIDAHEVLPHNPCSIAGAASLFAGSKMCDSFRQTEAEKTLGSEDLKAWAAEKQREWEKATFRMGWWEDGGGKRFGIDIVDDGKEGNKLREEEEQEEEEGILLQSLDRSRLSH